MLNFQLIIISTLLSIFSTVVMAYISMATPIGPWIAPTLALFSAMIFHLMRTKTDLIKKQTLVVSAGSIGGIVATAFGFAFPTLYFLSPTIFEQLIANRFEFLLITGGLALVAGGYGLLIADILEHRFIEQEKLVFPIGELVYEMLISLQNSMRKTYELLVGFVSATIYCMLQDGFVGLKGFIPRSITLINAQLIWPFALPTISFDLLPIWWAIGFVSGYIIALPLFIGMLGKIFIVGPVHNFFFEHVVVSDFILAFASGMVLFGALKGFGSITYRFFMQAKNDMLQLQASEKISNVFFFDRCRIWFVTNKKTICGGIMIGTAAVCYLSWMNFNFLEQLFLMVFTAICVYQITLIAGKTGLALLGRFATFVMVPALIFFDIDFTQIAILATFVEIAGGVATDVLFGRKMAYLANVPRSEIRRYQVFGLIVSAISIGLVLWYLINHFQLGSEQLFAQRAQARALFVSVRKFDLLVLALGAFFGFLLTWAKMSPMLVMGGLIMPINITIGLCTGGLLAYFTSQPEEKYPFWSGVFTASSLWMVLKAVI